MGTGTINTNITVNIVQQLFLKVWRVELRRTENGFPRLTPHLLMEGYENKHLLLGFDFHGNPLEIMYNDLEDDTISVFHAMPCRTSFISLLKP